MSYYLWIAGYNLATGSFQIAAIQITLFMNSICEFFVGHGGLSVTLSDLSVAWIRNENMNFEAAKLFFMYEKHNLGFNTACLFFLNPTLSKT